MNFAFAPPFSLQNLLFAKLKAYSAIKRLHSFNYYDSEADDTLALAQLTATLSEQTRLDPDIMQMPFKITHTSTFLVATLLLAATFSTVRADEAPADQKAFIAAAEAAREKMENAQNDLAAGAARRSRKKEMCEAVKSGKVKDWIGKVYSISTNGDGKGVLLIDIGSDVYVKTWNNDFSDINDKTLIDPDSELFSQLLTIKEGEKVRFSAQFIRKKNGPDCFSETSLSLSGSMSEPEFVARFATVEPIGN